ncbi:MAG TPA: exodeoxyribonuclease VII large subunit [Ignavibacteriaceae bacterium]|nr:exodeoxyribonuclease VII large subunit [Ignavibacteriaceae bacterium]
MNPILTVSELTKDIKQTLEEKFDQISVQGEISNFKAHVSGHWYFSLKDANASISCTMWKGFNSYVFFTPQDGMKVTLNGKISVYPPRGNYQVDVRSMKPSGVGELQAAFEALKQKLSDEGLFDEKFKKEVPEFPKKIGVITAIDGAAFRDMISVAERRFPLVEIVIAPSKVQGSGAAQTIAKSIRALNQQKDIDVIIVGRGGGSIEDLWAFNEEIVARAIFESQIPIISGVGHEIDFTIADFVSDLRAPTPSAAMELATPRKEDFFAFIGEFSYTSTQNLVELCSRSKGRISEILNSYGFRLPIDIVRKNFQNVDNISYRLFQNMDRKILVKNGKLSLLTKSIEAHDVNKSLRKGFVLVKQDSEFVTRASKLDKKKKTTLAFYDDNVDVKIKD